MSQPHPHNDVATSIVVTAWASLLYRQNALSVPSCEYIVFDREQVREGGGGKERNRRALF